jgi:hypothetical protein
MLIMESHKFMELQVSICNIRIPSAVLNKMKNIYAVINERISLYCLFTLRTQKFPTVEDSLLE